MSDTKRPQRPVRTALGTRNKLTVLGLKDQDQYNYRWVNDRDGRIQECWDKGYDFVDREGKVVGDGSFESASKLGTALSKGVGQGTTAYLMKIPKDLWEEQRKEAIDVPTDELEAGMQPAAGEGTYGKVEIRRK